MPGILREVLASHGEGRGSRASPLTSLHHTMLFRKKQPEDTTERLERLEKQMRRMEEEWSDVYGKFRTLQMRVAKQVQRLDQAPEREGTQPEGETPTVTPTSLSPRMQLIQKQIMERRKQNGGSE